MFLPCLTVYKTECQQEKSQLCLEVPETTCEVSNIVSLIWLGLSVYHQVSPQEVSRQVCLPVQRKQCVSVPQTSCSEVPREECKKVGQKSLLTHILNSKICVGANAEVFSKIKKSLQSRVRSSGKMSENSKN